jgi:hypothetical protein
MSLTTPARLGFGVVLALFFSAPLTVAQPDPGEKPVKEPTESELVAKDLLSPDEAVRTKALSDIRQMIADARSGKRKLAFNNRWVLNLHKTKQYEAAAELSVHGITMRPEQSAGVSRLQSYRVKALIAAGKADVALVEAKAFYNVCMMKDTEMAIELLAGALQTARPNEKGIGGKFIAQQVAASTVPDATNTAVPEDLGPSLLKSIQIDAKTYKTEIDLCDTTDFAGCTAKGNLLLLAGRTAEAKAVFQTASELAVGEAQQLAAIENIARAIRADTGSIGQANAYIVAHQSK